MDVHVDKTGPCLARISLTVPSEELEKEVQRALRNVGQRTRMKGFRPGKVPVKILEKSFGKQVRRDAVQSFVRQAYEKAVRDEELRPAAHPRIDDENMEVLVGSDLRLEFDLMLRPDVELGDTTGLEAHVPRIEVGDEELDAALEDVRRRQSRPESAGDDAGLEEDGMAVGKLELVLGEAVIEEREGMRLSPQHPPPGVEAEPYRDALVGATKGSTVEFPIAYPDDFHVEEARGRQGTCRLTLTEVFRLVGPTDEELYKMFDAEDEASMREKARERLLEARSEQRDQAVESQLLDQLLSTHPFDVPKPLVEQQVAARLERLEQDLLAQGVDPEQAKAQVEAESDRAYEASSRSLQALYLVEAIGQKEGLQITDEDLLAELKDIARRNGASVDDVRKYYREQNLFPQLATELLEKKVRTFLRENANLTEE
jgi:trigger factor